MVDGSSIEEEDVVVTTVNNMESIDKKEINPILCVSSVINITLWLSKKIRVNFLASSAKDVGNFKPNSYLCFKIILSE